MPRAQRADTQVMPSRGARLPGLAALVLHGHGAVALQGDDGEGTTEAPQLSSEQRQLQEAAARCGKEGKLVGGKATTIASASSREIPC